MSLDEREALHPTYSLPGHPDTADSGEDVDAGAFFFDPEPDVGLNELATGGGHHHRDDDDHEPVGVTRFASGGSGRHARHAAGSTADASVDHDHDHAGELLGSGHYAADSWDERRGVGATLLQAPPRRSAEREGRRKRRRRRLLLAIVLVILLVVAAAGWVGYKSFAPKPVADWTGTGTVPVTIEVNPGDGAQAIGTTLLAKGVVASVKAYTRAAAANDKSNDIAPGSYAVRKHMSGAAAVSLLVDPSAHLVAKLVVTEGMIEKDVVIKIASALNVSPSTVQAAAADIANLGLPDGYAPASGPLTVAEGFLYPDTYSLDPTSKASSALQLMASEFTTEDHEIGFADGVKKLGLTPYQGLIIASIAQAEVKFPTDVPKVVRVILNRLAKSMPLQIDATSVYGAKIAGLDPATVNYATVVTPYNSYLNAGLPPTPIGNPGNDVLKATITPVAGDWLYYVNGDAAGHLFFTDDPNAFEAAVATCRAQNWGCG